MLVCLSGCSSPHDKVSAAERDLIHRSLKGAQFDSMFGGAPPRTTVGCAEHVMGANRHANDVRVYLYLACGAWQLPGCGMTDGPEGSFPAVATVRSGSVSWQRPGDGDDYARDIHRLFPSSLQSAAGSPRLEPALARQAMQDAGCAPSV
jgi:hypothetical protein